MNQTTLVTLFTFLCAALRDNKIESCVFLPSFFSEQPFGQTTFNLECHLIFKTMLFTMLEIQQQKSTEENTDICITEMILRTLYQNTIYLVCYPPVWARLYVQNTEDRVLRWRSSS